LVEQKQSWKYGIANDGCCIITKYTSKAEPFVSSKNTELDTFCASMAVMVTKM
jgi:hypothetical protein